MNYTNHLSRLKLPRSSGGTQKPPTFFSLEPSPRGLRLCVRTAATLARRKVGASALAVAAVAWLLSLQTASAQLGYDPFASNSSHTEEKWGPYTTAVTGEVNRPNSTFVNGMNNSQATANSFGFGVTAPNPSNASVLGSGNIYSSGSTLTLTLASTYVPASGAFNTVIFSIKTLGNPLNTAGVLLTPNGGSAIAPIYTSIATSGSGMGASAQYAFQFDLSGIGGSNNFTIAVPGSASSVSYSTSQLDATTTAYGAQNLVPEPASLTCLAASLALGGVWWRTRRPRSGPAMT